jgi:hypothetical protein
MSALAGYQQLRSCVLGVFAELIGALSMASVMAATYEDLR